MTTAQLVQRLQDAMMSFAAGELGERELIAITMAVNTGLRMSIGDSYAKMADDSDAAMLDRIEELDRGVS